MKFRRIPIFVKNIFFLSLFALAAGYLMYNLYTNFQAAEEENRIRHLQQALDRTLIEFQDEMDKFGLLCTSLRSHVLSIGRVPDAEEMQGHIINQLRYSDYAHNLIINYIDTARTFVYSITEKTLESEIRSGFKLSMVPDTMIQNRMEEVLASDELVALPPVNVLEGFVGLPMNFRITFDGEFNGFIASIIDIKNILDPIFEKDTDQEFTYRFSYGNEVLFDREEVFTSTQVQHDRVDSLNLKLPKEDYLMASQEVYGVPFNIGIAYRDITKIDFLVPFLETSSAILLATFILLGIFLLLILQLFYRSRELQTSFNQISSLNSVLMKFNAAISHELRHPLNIISNNLKSFAAKNTEEFEGGDRHIKAITDNVQQMNNLMDDFKGYVGIIDHLTTKKKVDLNYILENIQLSYVDIPVKIFSEPLPTINGYEDQLVKLFNQLISNSFKFNESDLPTVIISSELYDDEVKIKVSDNGIGVKPEYLDTIFDDFMRRNKDQYPGTGLGLAICKEIVKNHKGEIRAEINNQGGLDVIFNLWLDEDEE
ncbi:MAG: HAMP domain-containing histidine kinase [Bacteroidia bacterium]|nr:HAMP domain-containing histidine kinase [Bacteroidia bacterium]